MSRHRLGPVEVERPEAADAQRRRAGTASEATHCRSFGISGVAFRDTPRDDALCARWFMEEEREKIMEIPIGQPKNKFMVFNSEHRDE